MRVVRVVLAGMVVAAVVNVAGFTLGARPAAADMQMGTSDMQMGTTCGWGISLSISAQNNAFDRDCLAAPPGERFTIVFDNKEAADHNIVILPEHDSTETLFRGEVITGPRSVTYSVGPLPGGSYHFHCEVHPTTMMGRFVLGGPGAAMSPGAMAMSPPGGMTMASGGGLPPEAGIPEVDDAAARPAPQHRGSGSVRTIVLLIGLTCAAGLVIVTGRRRTPRRGSPQAQTAPGASIAPASDPNMGRRDLVRLGAAGVAGAALAKLATSQSPAGAADRLGGVHISVFTHITGPEAAKGFPHHWTLTVYGPDNALSGMGWGGATDLKTQQDVFNSKMFPCIYSLTGTVEGDLVKVHGLMLFSGIPDQGLPLTFEGNLKTGALHVNAYNTFDFDGTGIVARI
jgi:plastocyanin